MVGPVTYDLFFLCQFVHVKKCTLSLLGPSHIAFRPRQSECLKMHINIDGSVTHCLFFPLPVCVCPKMYIGIVGPVTQLFFPTCQSDCLKMCINIDGPVTHGLSLMASNHTWIIYIDAHGWASHTLLFTLSPTSGRMVLSSICRLSVCLSVRLSVCASGLV